MRLLIRTEWAILGGQGTKTHVFLNFWRQNIVKSTTLKSCYYYCEYVCNLAVRNCRAYVPGSARALGFHAAGQLT